MTLAHPCLTVARPSFATPALEAAALKLRVHPVEPQGKKPLVSGWQAKATSDGNQILVWADTYPSANVGILCGNGLVVIDVDGPAGEASLRDVEMPATATVRTARGFHYYFWGSAQSRSGVLPGVDVRGWGGYVVGPGSLHGTGVVYEWLHHPTEVAIAPLPAALRRLLYRRPARRIRSSESLSIREGSRNRELTRLAGAMRRGGCSAECLRAGLRAENHARCVPALRDEEVEAMVASIERNWPAGGSPLDKPASFAANSGKLTPAAKFLLTLLIEHSDHRGRASMGMRRMAQIGKLDPGTVRQAVAQLQH